MEDDKWQIQNGFTLVELLIVISILGILASIALASFTASQQRGRDAERKSDLKQISSALELYYSDYGKYPGASATGLVQACPYNPSTGAGISCAWGGSTAFWDTKTTYIKAVPKDPISGQNYFYRIVPSSNNQKYQLYTHLEYSWDPNCLTDCKSPVGIPAGVTCGSYACNFSLTSPNTTPAE